MKDWISISVTIGGGLLPKSLLVQSIQNIGYLDALIRCMGQETATAIPQLPSSTDVDFGFHCQVMFSEFWICESYEVFRVLKAWKLLSGNKEFEALAHDLKLLRIPIAKHGIANYGKLSNPQKLQILSEKVEVTGAYEY